MEDIRKTSNYMLELLKTHNNYGASLKSGTDKESQHYYVSSFYEEAFRPYRDKNVNVLEIGINSGGSLLLWRDYFSNGNIFGVDISNSLARSVEEYKNITMYFENGYTPSFADKLPGLDIIIDDGPHTLQSQLECIKLFLPKLKSNGLMVIEDINDFNNVKHFQDFLSIRNDVASTQIIDTRAQYNQFDNIIFAIWKK